MKYKLTASEGWVIKIEDDGSKSASFTNRGEIGKKMWAEYQEWLSQGNTTEPEFTPEELVAKEAGEAAQQQESSNQAARKFLSDNDWKGKRHRDQLDMIERGLIEDTSLTEEEYAALLIECQEKRDSIIEDV